MTTYTSVFGNFTTPPSEFGYQDLSISANTELVWPYNSDGGTTTSKIMEVTATVGSLTLTLPDATQVSNGEDILIRNVGADAFDVLDNGGNILTSVTAGIAQYLYVTDNSTAAGTWGQITYGAGSASVDAASLVGYGIIALGSTLNQSHPVTSTASAFTVGLTHRASLINYTGGSDTATLTTVATLGNNFFTMVHNSGTGTLTLDPAGAELIDGAATLTLQPGESAMLCSSGSAWFTVGLGRSLTYNFTQLVKDVSVGTPFTLSDTEAANKLLTFVGNPATAVEVVVPSTVAVYYVLSDISTAQDITIKTSGGVGTLVGQGQRAILICDGSEVYLAVSITAGSSISLIDGSDALPSLSFISQTNTGLYKYGADGYGFSVNGVARYTDDGTTITQGSLTGVIYRTAGVESAATGTQIIATPTNAATSKATPVDADELPLVDSAASNVLKKLTWANLKTTLGSTFAALAGSISQVFSASQIELGHASDTTLTRSSAGVLAVEGNTVPMNGTGQVATFGTVELGHASDTTLSRASAGVLAVEGASVATLSTTQVWANPQKATVTTDNDLSFDLSARLFFVCTPAAGGALTFTNIPADGCWVTIKLVNGSNYAITAHANTKVTSSFLSTISATGTYIISGYCDGTNVHCSTPGASA